MLEGAPTNATYEMTAENHAAVPRKLEPMRERIGLLVAEEYRDDLYA